MRMWKGAGKWIAGSVGEADGDQGEQNKKGTEE